MFFCIRHGGGKHCEVAGCDKSAQSRPGRLRRFCKAHGGGECCKVDGFIKNIYASGCCRAHSGGGLQSKNKNKRVAITAGQR